MTAAPYREVVVATGNPGKLLEIRAILGELPVSLRSAAAFPEVRFPEEGDDYEQNAIEKARAVARDTGRVAIGDDSGIEVAALGGRPGPRSARYGGEGLDDAGRVAKLLEELEGVDDRAARFVCWAAVATPDGDVATAFGECVGRILSAPRGDGGFGYDPIFEVGETGRSMAELPEARKNEISHRARALNALLPSLRKVLP